MLYEASRLWQQGARGCTHVVATCLTWTTAREQQSLGRSCACIRDSSAHWQVGQWAYLPSLVPALPPRCLRCTQSSGPRHCLLKLLWRKAQ